MGRAPRLKQERLGEKLLKIRLALGLSQELLINRLGIEEVAIQRRISTYEAGTHEPPLQVLLQYARAANVYLEAIVDDELDLPDKLPSPTKSEGTRRKSAARRKVKR
jgi:transcriptional regulator with XRE-family HTH domain